METWEWKPGDNAAPQYSPFHPTTGQWNPNHSQRTAAWLHADMMYSYHLQMQHAVSAGHHPTFFHSSHPPYHPALYRNDAPQVGGRASPTPPPAFSKVSQCRMRRYRHPQDKEGECSLPKSAGNQKLDEPQQQKPEPKTKKTTPAQQPSSQLISMQTNKNTNSGQLDTKQLVGQENSSCNPLDLSCFTKQDVKDIIKLQSAFRGYLVRKSANVVSSKQTPDDVECEQRIDIAEAKYDEKYKAAENKQQQQQQQQDPEVGSGCTENVATTAETSALQSSNNLEENAARADELKIFKF